MKNIQVTRLLAYVTGLVNHQLLLQNEYLIAENRILRSHLPARVPLTNAQRATLAEIAKRMSRWALKQAASVAKPETILAWYRKLIAPQVRWFQRPRLPGTARSWSRDNRTGCPDGLEIPGSSSPEVERPSWWTRDTTRLSLSCNG
jgi:hypothetical protein